MTLKITLFISALKNDYGLFKVTHTVCFSISFYIINQKPVIPTNDFHCIITWVAHSSGCNSAINAFAYFVFFVFTSQMALLFNINI